MSNTPEIEGEKVPNEQELLDAIPEPKKSQLLEALSGVATKYRYMIIMLFLAFIAGAGEGCYESKTLFSETPKKDEAAKVIKDKPDEVKAKPDTPKDCTVDRKHKDHPKITSNQRRVMKKYPGTYYDSHITSIVTPHQQKHYLADECLRKFSICMPQNKGIENDMYLLDSPRQSIIRVNRKLIEKEGFCLKLRSVCRPDNAQKKIKDENDEKSFWNKTIVGDIGNGDHPLGQAFDSGLSGKRHLIAKKYLLKEGWLDIECCDYGHFSYRKKYSNLNRCCSKINDYFVQKGSLSKKACRLGIRALRNRICKHIK